jgi:hypothetical protein
MCAQEAAERPSFAEIIQVLRQLLADEARRVPTRSPGEERMHAGAHSSGDSSRAVRQARAPACLPAHPCQCF